MSFEGAFWTNPVYEVKTSKAIKTIVIDPTQRLADVDYKNNVYN